MAFDPDKFLESRGVAPEPEAAAAPKAPAAAFDPDAFVAARTQPARETAQPSQVPAPNSDQINPRALEQQANQQLSVMQAQTKLPYDSFPSQTQPKGPQLSAVRPEDKFIDGFLASRLGKLPEPTLNLEVNVPFEEKLARQVQAGLQENLAFNAIRAVEKLATGNTQSFPNAEYGAVSLATQALDPVAYGVFKVGEGIAGALSTALGVSKAVQRARALGTVSERGLDMGLSSAIDAARKSAFDYAKSRSAELAIHMSVTGGTYGAVLETEKQVASNEPFKPSEIGKAAARDALIGLGIGAAGAAYLGASAFRKAGQLDKLSAIVKPSSAEATGKLTKVTLSSDEQTVQEAMDEAYRDAKATVATKIAMFRQDPKTARIAVQETFLENLSQRGIPMFEGNPLPGPVLNPWLRQFEKFTFVDEKTGTRAAEVIKNFTQGEFEKSHFTTSLRQQFSLPMKRLNKLGVDNKSITQLMQYVEDTPEGNIIFNPLGRRDLPGSNMRLPWQGKPIRAEVMSELAQLRATFTRVLVENPELAEKVGYVEGYVPLLPAQTSAKFKLLNAESIRKIVDPSFSKSREYGYFDLAEHEADFAVLANYYSELAGKHVAFNKHMPQLIEEITKLQFLQQSDVADELAKAAMRSMGMKGKLNLGTTFGKEVATANGEILRQVVEQVKAPAGFLENATKVMRDMVANNLIFLNPRTYVKAALEPEFVGGGEIGPRWVAAGRKAIAVNKDVKVLAEKVLPLMRASDASDLENIGVREVKGLGWKAVEFLGSGISKKLGQIAFNPLDAAGRKTSFAGAYLQFKDALKKGGAQGTDAVLDGLLTSERALVRKAFKQGGDEAAAQMYGILRARRIHFAYAQGDKADAFAEGLGRQVPFTTWSSNQFARLVGEYHGQEVKQFSRRLVTPILYAATFRAVTGQYLPGSHPFSAVTDMATGNAMPVIDQVNDAARQKGGSGAAKALIPFTQYGPVARFQRELKKSHGDVFGTTLRITKAKKPGNLDSELKALFKSLAY